MGKKDEEGSAGLLKYIIGICIVCMVVVLVMVATGAFSGDSKKKSATASKEPVAEVKPDNSQTMIGIVKDIDKTQGILTIRDLENGVDQIFTYDGTTSFFSRYNQPLTINGIPFGEIVEVTFDTTNSKIKTCDITDQAWEYKKVNKWKMDKASNMITIGSKSYQFSDLLYAFDSKGELDTNALCDKDQVTIKGIGGQAYSIIVTSGHATVQLTGYEAFLGGTIEVGYEVITTVTDDMILTVREGDYKVTITKDGLSATKYIKLQAGDDYKLDFSEYEAEKVQTGKCYFDVTPEGADLYINDAQADYSKAIELAYGTYEIKVECAGYQTYYAKLTVADEKEVLTITLVDESKAAESASPSPDAIDDDVDSDTPSTSPTVTPSPSSSPTASASPTTSTTPKTSTINKIQIFTPIGASVYLNDTFKGTIPLVFDKVSGDDMRLTLTMEGHDSKSYTVTVKDDGNDVVWSFEKWWE